jgi:ubiquinone/menaquinone biosynthesis C-methylase UbiE
MRAFFYLLYQPMAWSYDLVAALVSWGRWKEWIMTALPYLGGPQILELGHGPGHLQVALHRKGISTFGLDVSRQMGKQASKRISMQGYSQKLSCGYAQKTPFSDNSFDQIAATFPTDYIYSSEALAEIHRVLKPDGMLVVLPAAWITGKSLVDRWAATLFMVTGQTPEMDSHPGWKSKWLEPFTQAGFQTQTEMIYETSWSLVIILARKVP